MRILFDNGTPRQLRRQLFGHDVEEAREHGWDALSNGDLLDRAEEAGYEVVITTDQDTVGRKADAPDSEGRGLFSRWWRR